PTKGKQLTNMRSKASDEAIALVPPTIMSVEKGLETIDDDEYLEITPKSELIRKQSLTEAGRRKINRQLEKTEE
ncbi:MAG: GTP-binding protein, partial [Patescibacteria group bacterium]|nr:GTP-binding protein [Patescibacteria group bacterium]